MVEQKDLEKLEDGSIVKYWRIALPMMSQRDNVVKISKLEVDGGILLSVQTVEHPEKPPTQNVIRMFAHVVTFMKQKGENVTMLDFEYANLKGYLPASLLNMAIASEYTKSLQELVANLHAK